MLLYNASVVIKNKKSSRNVKYLCVLAYNVAPYTALLFPDFQLFAPSLTLPRIPINMSYKTLEISRANFIFLKKKKKHYLYRQMTKFYNGGGIYTFRTTAKS